MTDLALVADQIRYEQKSYWRNPAAAFFTFAFPLVFFFILTGLAGGSTDNKDLGIGVKLSQYYTPSILAYALMSACFLSLTMGIVRRREGGILKRFRGSPLPTWALVGGFIGSSMIVSILLSVVEVAAGRLFFGVHIAPAHLVPLAVMIVLASLAFCALGIAISSLIPNDDSGPAIVNLPFFLLVFISGTYFPVTGTLKTIASYFPLEPLNDGLYRCFVTQAGGLWSGHDVLTLVVWGVAGSVFAARHFRWTPRKA
jgi:ABC-2 type transport system permease protein